MGVVRKGMLVAAMCVSWQWVARTSCTRRTCAVAAEPRASGQATAKPPISRKADPAQLTALHGEIAAARREDRRAAEASSVSRRPAHRRRRRPQLAGIESDDRPGHRQDDGQRPGRRPVRRRPSDARRNRQGDARQGRGAIKKDYAGKHVRVDGHTDADPIKVQASGRQPGPVRRARPRRRRSTWCSRASPATHIDARGFGSDKPRQEQGRATAAWKSSSRRGSHGRCTSDFRRGDACVALLFCPHVGRRRRRPYNGCP